MYHVPAFPFQHFEIKLFVIRFWFLAPASPACRRQDPVS